MRCPFCQAPLEETQASCGGCGISLERMDPRLGPAPPVSSGLADLAGILSAKDCRRIRRELREIEIVFQQLHVSVATVDGVPEGVNLSAYTFWLFNRSDIVRQFDTDGRNYDILFTIDSRSRHAALIIGYGLEPFVGKHHLTEVLASGHSHLVVDGYAAAILTMLDTLRTLLREIAAGIPAAFALAPAPVVEAKSMTEAALDF